MLFRMGNHFAIVGWASWRKRFFSWSVRAAGCLKRAGVVDLIFSHISLGLGSISVATVRKYKIETWLFGTPDSLGAG